MTQETTQERSLFESERAVRLLVEGVTDYAICMLDTQGVVSSWNAGATRITGYESKEILGQHFSVFYPQEDRAILPKRALETAQRDGRFEAEGWRVRKDGTRFFASVVIDALHESGNLVGFAKITRDFTERMQARAALSESENHFRLLVSNVTDYALYMLDPDGMITNWNLGGQRIKGYLPDEIIGQHFSRFYTPADREAGKPARALQTAREKGRYEEEGLRVRKDGTFFWANVIIDPVLNDVGELVGFAKITRDITERREAQKKIEHMQKQLAESQKMDALGQLTGGVAHDFNNLLMAVMGNTRLIKRFAVDARAVKAAENIEATLQRGAALTRQLLTFARRQQVNPVPLQLHEAIDAAQDVLKTGLGNKAHLEFDIPPALWPVLADFSEFETALVNLVLNARDAMPEGGTVRISASNEALADGDLAGNYVAITVSDTGVGIAEDVLSKVFDPFFTTKPIGKGTGLGLSQVHGFASQAGGFVRIASRLNEGTRVTIWLPRIARDKVSPEADTLANAAGTVLLVEDNPDVASSST
ncbi:MAG: PAS domain S-box protein, partial [Bradyrhizobium sp.]